MSEGGLYQNQNPTADRDQGAIFRAQLERILNKPLTVENIGTFADIALQELLELNEDVLNTLDLNEAATAADEDVAYTKYDLPDLQEVLERIVAVQVEIDEIQQHLAALAEAQPDVFVPPDPHTPIGRGGAESFTQPELFPRLVTLTYILAHDLGIPKEELRFTRGSTTADMVRNEPYIRVEIDDLGRVAYVCDEEKNASYVFDTGILEMLDIGVAELDGMSKKQRGELISAIPESGTRIIQSPHWRTHIANALAAKFGSGTNATNEPREAQSEFREGKKWPSFTDFQAEVRTAWEALEEKTGGIYRWYVEEQKKHNNWPRRPEIKYRDKGWTDWRALVGIESFSYDQLHTAVLAVWKELKVEPVNSIDWYAAEQEKHDDWPAHPENIFEGKGWMGWPTFVGREVREFLSYTDLETSVREAWDALKEKPAGVVAWYAKERLKHEKWPVNPDEMYKGKGWISWPALVGRKEKELLTFEPLKTAVRAVWNTLPEEPTTISPWYKQEQKLHDDWPVNPAVTFKDKGWKGYVDLVGKVVEQPDHPTFDEFKTQVRTVWKEAGSPKNKRGWYVEEQKKHNNWPSNPNRTYKNDGWEGYTALLADAA